jgi:thiol-disulfide isomerase/thioredoxin
VYYQWVKIQAWCRLCLLVVGVLALQIGFFSYTVVNGLFAPVIPGGAVLGTALLLFLGIGSAVIWIKELIKSEEQAIQAEAISNRVKYDPKIFSQYLLKQRKVDETPFEKEIYIGNPEAPLRLVMASNLFCNPCKAMHEKLNTLVQVWPDKLQICFRFLPVKKDYEEDSDPREVLLNYWLEHIQGTETASQKTQQIIRDWFERESIDEFINKYGIDSVENLQELRAMMELQDPWIKTAEITKTPTLFLNGFEFPQQYSVGHLTAMIPGLIDHFQHQDELTDNSNNEVVKEIV